jgi:L-ribulose-5-phosphate 3-epimerase
MEKQAPALEHLPLGLFEKALPPDLSWPERLRAAAGAGFDFVELSIDDSDERIARLDWSADERARLRSAILDSGVPILSMSLSAHRRFALGSASETDRQRGLDIFRKAIDFTLDVGLRCVQVCGADAYHEGSSASSRARFLEGLERGFEWASRAGVMLALENWDRGIVTVTEAMWYVRHFNSPWFQHYVDLGNLVFAGRDVLKELEAARGHIVAVHARDAVRGQLWEVPLGEGRVPFVEAFARLAQLGFRGPVVLAISSGSQPSAVEYAAAAGRWLRERMAAGRAAAALPG